MPTVLLFPNCDWVHKRKVLESFRILKHNAWTSFWGSGIGLLVCVFQPLQMESMQEIWQNNQQKNLMKMIHNTNAAGIRNRSQFVLLVRKFTAGRIWVLNKVREVTEEEPHNWFFSAITLPLKVASSETTGQVKLEAKGHWLFVAIGLNHPCQEMEIPLSEEGGSAYISKILEQHKARQTKYSCLQS